MSKILIVVDMQNDFICGSLGSKNAEAVTELVAEKIKEPDWDYIFFTLDTHTPDYLNTQEGVRLPIKHCILNTDGHSLHSDILTAYKECLDLYPLRQYRFIRKNGFGSLSLSNELCSYFSSEQEIEIVGLCTDICVLSNAILVKSALPEARITVDARCCSGTSFDNHLIALKAMETCQIDIKNKPSSSLDFL